MSDEVRLRIGRMVYGGAAIGVTPTDGADGADGSWGKSGEEEPRTVPFALPGELVSIAEMGVRTSGDVTVLEASADRVAPGCRHFGVCGGCQYQHAGYGAQLGIKAGILRDLLEVAGVVDTPEILVHAGEPWGYRNRVRVRVERAGGELRVGYNARVSRGDGTAAAPDFVPISECPIAAPLLWRGAVAFLRVAGRALRGSRAAWLNAVVEVELFATGDERRLQMTVFTRSGGSEKSDGRRREAVSERQFEVLCEGVRAEVPELVGAGVMVLPAVRLGAGSRPAQRSRAGVSWGATGLSYGAVGRSYWVSRGGFFQVNRFLVDELVRLVTGGRRGALAWDLYAGVGLFSRALTEGFGEVVAVESGEVAAVDLAAWARRAGVRAVGMTTLDFLRLAVVDRGRPELVVMDPPRAGVGLEVAGLLGRVGAREMVYVSCDPTTLARDLRAMVDSGYNLAELHLVDLFPQTFHMETVAVLRR